MIAAARPARGKATLAAGFALLGIVGAAAFSHGMAVALAGRVPELAMRWNPWVAGAPAQLANLLVQRDQSPTAFARARSLAQRALRQDATNVTAMSVIGMTARDPALAGRAFRLTERYSRRNFPAQLWLIEDAVQRDDVPAVLRHYDIALRTYRQAAPVLFPVLVAAASDPALQPEIANALAKRPPWGALYVQQLAQSGRDPEATARLFVELARRGVDPGAPALSALYARLVEARSYDTAWALYRTRQPQAERRGLRNASFAEAPGAASPFEWQLSDEIAATARLERSGAAGRLVFDAAAGEGGEVARQLLLLPPGTHRIAVAFADVDVPGDGPPPFVQLSCDRIREPLLRLPLARGNGRAAANVTVPAGCPAQVLSLTVQAAEAPAAVTGALLRVAID